MKLPKLTQPILGRRSPVFSAIEKSVEPQDCGLGKKIACAAAVAACSVACATGVGVPACAACFASIGAGSCIDCA